jgi:hypothetical protein
MPASYGLNGTGLLYRIQISHSVPCVSNNREMEVNGLYSLGVLSGFNIMIDRQRQTKYTVGNDMARGAKKVCVTRVDIVPQQE